MEVEWKHAVRFPLQRGLTVSIWALEDSLFARLLGNADVASRDHLCVLHYLLVPASQEVVHKQETMLTMCT